MLFHPSATAAIMGCGPPPLKIHEPPEASCAGRVCLTTPVTITTWTEEQWSALDDPPPGAVRYPNGVRVLIEID